MQRSNLLKQFCFIWLLLVKAAPPLPPRKSKLVRPKSSRWRRLGQCRGRQQPEGTAVNGDSAANVVEEDVSRTMSASLQKRNRKKRNR